MADIQIAISQGYKVPDSLETAKISIDSAKSWGLIDIIGGGFFTTLIKHSKMDDAQVNIREAENAVRTFNDSLMRLNLENINVDTKNLLGVLDIFCDGLFVDLFMQSRINEALDSVNLAIKEISIVLKELQRDSTI